MERTLRVLRDLEREGVIARYAIGGGIGALFYMEPFLTYDLDVFVALPEASGGSLSFEPLYSALRGRGCVEEGECVKIEGVPVQFLPPYNALAEEALAEARETNYESVPVRVMRAEHLAAIMVQTGREKDRRRFSSFIREAELDRAYLDAVLRRHGLRERWEEWAGSP